MRLFGAGRSSRSRFATGAIPVPKLHRKPKAEYDHRGGFFYDQGIVSDVRGLLHMLEVRAWKMSGH